MDFQTAIKTCLSRYADFEGRARRSEFWYFVLFQVIVAIVTSFVSDWLYALAMLGLLVPALAAGCRRLHDTGRSGWWQLISLVPLVGWIILIVFAAQAGNAGSNAYGEDPKAGTAA